MMGGTESTLKRAIVALILLCLVIVAPRSLAEDLLSPLIGTVDAPQENPASEPSTSPEESASPTPIPSSSPTIDAAPATASTDPTATPAPALVATESPTAAISPTPVPPHAIADQFMTIAVPITVSTDPRAHSVFLPRIQVSGVETLLICGYSNATSVSFISHLPGVESSGSGTPFFQISGPAHLVAASLNGEMGAQVISNAKAIPGLTLSLTFVALSQSSINPNLCNDGSSSNNRTISFRALSMDLNMVKDPVRLK